MFRRPLLLLSALLAVAPLSAQTTGASGIKFKGVLVQGDEVKVCLVNLATNNAKWVPIGGKTAGYIVKSCATKVAYPYVVLAPSSGRGPETILRLDEVAAPVSPQPVIFDLPRRTSTLEMPIISSGFLQHADPTETPGSGISAAPNVHDNMFQPLVARTMTNEIGPRVYVAYDPSGSPPDLSASHLLQFEIGGHNLSAHPGIITDSPDMSAPKPTPAP